MQSGEHSAPCPESRTPNSDEPAFLELRNRTEGLELPPPVALVFGLLDGAEDGGKVRPLARSRLRAHPLRLHLVPGAEGRVHRRSEITPEVAVVIENLGQLRKAPVGELGVALLLLAASAAQQARDASNDAADDGADGSAERKAGQRA